MGQYQWANLVFPFGELFSDANIAPMCQWEATSGRVINLTISLDICQKFSFSKPVFMIRTFDSLIRLDAFWWRSDGLASLLSQRILYTGRDSTHCLISPFLPRWTLAVMVYSWIIGLCRVKLTNLNVLTPPGSSFVCLKLIVFILLK